MDFGPLFVDLDFGLKPSFGFKPPSFNSMDLFYLRDSISIN